jgi:beta-1,4-N-acetylglucosaminyltransferase
MQGDARDCDLYSIPRSREVGQSYFTSVFTTLYSMLYAFALVLQVQPEVVSGQRRDRVVEPQIAVVGCCG